MWINEIMNFQLERCFNNNQINIPYLTTFRLFWDSWFVCLRHQKPFYLWKFSSVSSRCKRISSAHSREGAPVIFSFTLWNNCLNIACSISWSSPEKLAILLESNAHAHYSGSEQTLRAAHAQPHSAPAGAPRRSPGDHGKRFGVGPPLPARLGNRHLTWGKQGSTKHLLCYSCWPSVPTEHKVLRK